MATVVVIAFLSATPAALADTVMLSPGAATFLDDAGESSILSIDAPCQGAGPPPEQLDKPDVIEHDAWVVDVLAGNLHMSPDQVGGLSGEEA